jgi:hypothetical protein
LDGHEFVEDHDVFHFFCFDFDSVFVVEVVSGLNFDVLTQWFDSAIHVQLFVLQVVMNLFVCITLKILSNEIL